MDLLRFWKRDEPFALLESLLTGDQKEVTGPAQLKSVLEDWPWSLAPASDLANTRAFLTPEQAVGIPAYFGVIRRCAHAVGMTTIKVYKGSSPTRSVATDSPQWELLHRRPNNEAKTPFAFNADIAGALLTRGNAYARKIKLPSDNNRVGELVPLDARRVKPERRNGRIFYDDQTESVPLMRTDADIIHFRTFALNGSLEGISPITAARTTVATALKRRRFENVFYDNDARPGIVLKFPHNLDAEKAEEWREVWEAAHRGVNNSHLTGVIGGGAEIEQFPISLADAQFVEASNMTADDVAAIYHVPTSFIRDTPTPTSDVDNMLFVTYALGPIYSVIEQTLSADRDLFPRGSDMFCEFLADALLRPDTKTRYEAYRLARQAGWLTPNEIRALENYPPVKGGDEIQITPVGGAPNETAKAFMTLAMVAAQADDPGSKELVRVAGMRALTNGHLEVDDLDRILAPLTPAQS